MDDHKAEPQIMRDREEIHFLLQRAEEILQAGEADAGLMARAEAFQQTYRWLVGADHHSPLA